MNILNFFLSKHSRFDIFPRVPGCKEPIYRTCRTCVVVPVLSVKPVLSSLSYLPDLCDSIVVPCTPSGPVLSSLSSPKDLRCRPCRTCVVVPALPLSSSLSSLLDLCRQPCPLCRNCVVRTCFIVSARPVSLSLLDLCRHSCRPSWTGVIVTVLPS